MTIQLRVRSWAALVRWLEWRYRCKWPRSAQDLVDYILGSRGKLSKDLLGSTDLV